MSRLIVQSDKLYIEVHSSDGGVTALTINEAEQLQSELSSAILNAKIYAASLDTFEQRAEKVAALMAIIDPKQESEENS